MANAASSAAFLAGDPLVLATGGGAFMDPETRATIRREGISVWLRCKLPTLVRRVAGRSHRPLLADGNPADTLARLMDARHPTYAESDLVVDCGDEPPDHTTAKVLQALRDWRPARRLHVALSSRPPMTSWSAKACSPAPAPC